MNVPEIAILNSASGAITGVNVYILNRHRKLRKEQRDADRRTQADRADSHTRENARGGAGLSLHSIGAEKGASAGIEIVDQPDPIRAWKSLALKADDHTVFLCSHHTGGQIELEAKAICSGRYTNYSSPTPPHGAVPELTCACGWYAIKDRAKLKEMGYGSVVIAEVDLYGSVIEAEHGYRAEYQRVLAVLIRRDYCRGGFLCPDQPELLDFLWTEEQQYLSGGQYTTIRSRKPTPVCRAHASEEAVELSRVASRLGVEVRWDTGGQSTEQKEQ